MKASASVRRLRGGVGIGIMVDYEQSVTAPAPDLTNDEIAALMSRATPVLIALRAATPGSKAEGVALKNFAALQRELHGQREQPAAGSDR